MDKRNLGISAPMERRFSVESSNQAVYEDIHSIIEEGRCKLAIAVNSSIVEAYWRIGKRIYDEIGERAPRNSRLLTFLSKRLTSEYGKDIANETSVTCAAFISSFQIGTHCVPI